jgi:hypothetical protein
MARLKIKETRLKKKNGRMLDCMIRPLTVVNSNHKPQAPNIKQITKSNDQNHKQKTVISHQSVMYKFWILRFGI